MSWLDGTTDSMDMSVSKFLELVMDREAWHAVVHRVTKSRTRLSDLNSTIFTAALFIIAMTWKQTKCSLTDKLYRRCGTYTQWNITQP